LEAEKKCLGARSRFGSNLWLISKFQISIFPFFLVFQNFQNLEKMAWVFIIGTRFELGFDLKCKWTTQYQGYIV
jgi:hypothetical protein